MSKCTINAQAWKESCKTFSEKAMKIVMEEINNSLPEIAENVQRHYDEQNIKKITGKLYAGTKIHKMEVSEDKVKTAYIINDVINPRIVKKPGKRNIAMKNRYKGGTHYGRLIEFSPRINKPFFYPAMDESKEKLRERIKKRWKDEKLL